MQVFHPMYSMLYTVNLGLCDYVPFLADPVTYCQHVSDHLTEHTPVNNTEMYTEPKYYCDT